MRLGLLAITLATACDWPVGEYCEGDWAAAPPESAPPRSTARTVAQVLPVESTAIDILFVIDDSSSMTDEQAQLGIWSRELFDVLSTEGELPDLHIAVTSSSFPIPGLTTQCLSGAGGSLYPGRSLTPGDWFLRDVAGPEGRERNYTGDITEAFAQMALVGASGCGFEQPFKAARLALAHGVGDKKFLRDDALLLVVFVTDEDDCSIKDPALFSEPYADACTELGTLTSYRCFEHGVTCYDGKGSREFGERRDCRPNENSRYVESVRSFAETLKGVKQNPAQIAVAAIYGKPNHVEVIPDERVTSFQTPRLAASCGSGFVEGSGATPAIRMNALLAEFGGRASQSSICDSELSWAMRETALVARGAAKRSPCLRGGLIDANRVEPGIQPRCEVHAMTGARTKLETRVAIPECDRSGGDRCFTIDFDATCETETQLAVRLTESQDHETLVVDCEVPNSVPDSR
jgi:hypothetical protein